MLDLATIKAHLRIDTNQDDAVLLMYMSAAYSFVAGKISGPVETASGRVAYFDNLGDMDICPRLQSVESITYHDDDGAEQTLGTDIYQVVTSAIVGRVVLAYGQEWPGHQVFPESVVVTYTAGFETIPTALDQAVLMYIGHLYNNAEATAPIDLSTVPMAVDSLIAPYVNYRL